MDLAVGLYLVLGLVIVLVFVHRMMKARRLRRKLERFRNRTEPRQRLGPTSPRAEMRAYDDPSTLAEGMTTKSRGGFKGAVREKQ